MLKHSCTFIHEKSIDKQGFFFFSVIYSSSDSIFKIYVIISFSLLYSFITSQVEDCTSHTQQHFIFFVLIYFFS